MSDPRAESVGPSNKQHDADNCYTCNINGWVENIPFHGNNSSDTLMRYEQTRFDCDRSCLAKGPQVFDWKALMSCQNAACERRRLSGWYRWVTHSKHSCLMMSTKIKPWSQGRFMVNQQNPFTICVFVDKINTGVSVLFYWSFQRLDCYWLFQLFE